MDQIRRVTRQNRWRGERAQEAEEGFDADLVALVSG